MTIEIVQEVLGTLTLEDTGQTVHVVQETADVVAVAEQGPPGPAGANGAAGPVGPVGPAGTDATYVHDQGAPSTVWTINHNLGKRPAVFVENSAGDDMIGEIDHPTVNQTVLTFSASTGGKAFLN